MAKQNVKLDSSFNQQPLKIPAVYDDAMGVLSVTATDFRVPPVTPPPTNVEPPKSLTADFSPGTGVMLMVPPVTGMAYYFYRNNPAVSKDWVRVNATPSANGMIVDPIMKQPDTKDTTFFYTANTVRLSDKWESIGCEPVQLTIKASNQQPPQPPMGGDIPIKAVVPNVSSVVVEFGLLAAAKDYAIGPIGDLSVLKAMGPPDAAAGTGRIEWNGDIPGGKLRLFALDRIAPYVPHMNSWQMPPNMQMGKWINGQSVAGTEPIVIAQSVDIPVTYKGAPSAPGGLYLGFDTPDAITRTSDGDTHGRFDLASGKASVISEQSDYTNVDFFVSRKHPMIRQVDGPSPGHGVVNQENSVSRLEINQAFPFSGKVFRMYQEWDARLDAGVDRRWLKFMLWNGNSKLLTAVNIDEDFLGHEKIKHVEDGSPLLIWRVGGDANLCKLVVWNTATQTKKTLELTNFSWDHAQKPGTDVGKVGTDRRVIYKPGSVRTLNGNTDADIDIRHGFALETDGKRVVAYEIDPMGYKVKAFDVDIAKFNIGGNYLFPNGLPYNSFRMATGVFLYHTELGLTLTPSPPYNFWHNCTPRESMAHGDNLTVTIQDSFSV